MRQTRPSSTESNTARMDGLTFPLPSPAPGCALGCVAAPDERARGWSRALHSSEPLFEQGLVQSSNSEPTSGNWRLLSPENQNRKERERERMRKRIRKKRTKEKEKVRKSEGGRRSPECYISSSLEWVFFNANNLIFTFYLNLRCCYKLSTSLLFPLSL